MICSNYSVNGMLVCVENFVDNSKPKKRPKKINNASKKSESRTKIIKNKKKNSSQDKPLSKEELTEFRRIKFGKIFQKKK